MTLANAPWLLFWLGALLLAASRFIPAKGETNNGGTD